MNERKANERRSMWVYETNGKCQVKAVSGVVDGRCQFVVLAEKPTRAEAMSWLIRSFYGIQ